MITDSELDALLSAEDPARALKGRAPATESLVVGIASGPSRTRRRLLGTLFAGLIAITAGLTAPAAVAGITEYLAQTGDFCNPANSTECGDVVFGSPDSEYIDNTKPDFAEYVAAQFPDDIPRPDTYTKQQNIDTAVSGMTREPMSFASLGVQSSFEFAIRCAWMKQWLDADPADVATRDEAATQLAAAATYDGLVRSDGGGVIDAIRATAQAAADDDRPAVAQEFAINCAPAFEHMQ